jgi:hypothetical protein
MLVKVSFSFACSPIYALVCNTAKPHMETKQGKHPDNRVTKHMERRKTIPKPQQLNQEK